MLNKYDELCERQQLVDRYRASGVSFNAAASVAEHQFISGGMAMPDAQAFVRIYEYKIGLTKRFSFPAPD
jgi:hypothetical protein